MVNESARRDRTSTWFRNHYRVPHMSRKTSEMWGPPIIREGKQILLPRQAHQLLGLDPGTQDRDFRNLAARHRYFIAAVEPGAVLAVLVDLVGQGGSILHHAEAVAEEEIGDAGEETDTADAVILGFIQQGLQEHAPGAFALCFRADHDRAYLGQMRTVEVQGPASLEDAPIGLRDGKVAHVLADLCEGPPQQR